MWIIYFALIMAVTFAIFYFIDVARFTIIRKLLGRK